MRRNPGRGWILSWIRTRRAQFLPDRLRGLRSRLCWLCGFRARLRFCRRGAARGKHRLTCGDERLGAEVVALVFDRVLLLVPLRFLIVIGLDDVTRHWRRSGSAVLAAFDQHGHDDFGLAARGIADEPGVI